jgi:hypothetical protein
MIGVEIIASRTDSRRALLVGFIAMAGTALLLDRIAVAATDSTTAQGHPRQRLKSKSSNSTGWDKAAQTRPELDARERLSLPAYFPLE